MAINESNTSVKKGDEEVLVWVNVMVNGSRVCAVPIKDVKFKTKVEDALLEFLGGDEEASLEAVITLRKPNGNSLDAKTFKRIDA